MSRLAIDLHKTSARHAFVGDSNTTVIFQVAEYPVFSINDAVESTTTDDEMSTLDSGLVDDEQGSAILVSE